MARKSATKTQPEPEVQEVTPSTFTPAEFAKMVGSDPKTVRRFLRSVTQQKAGKGGRWTIDSALLPELKTRWEARGTAQTVTELPAEDEAIEELTDELDDIDG